ncbi:MAG: GNAT family N-acetyltransferase [Acidobacteria bacterium]|nr:GNAT family N-acetyltransferase [Acidobacteriota bacterium]
MTDGVRYRAMRPGEAAAVSALVLSSFDEFIGPELTDEGNAEFRRFAAPDAIASRTAEDHFVRVATVDGALAGMIEIRQNNHVALLFVDKAHQHHGIAKGLLHAGLADARAANPDLERVTVNSSRYGVPAYEKLGFRQTGPERAVNGIAFIPMAMRLDADL